MDTRMKLLLAAERLFALHGPAGTSSRAIMTEAGQRNASAINYYFPTRDALIEAICELRMEPINRARIERVAQYLSDKPAPADRLRALIAILCEPALAPIIEAKGKSYFRRFLAQAINNPSSNFHAIVRDRFDTSIRQLVPLIRDEVAHLPRAIANKRISMMIRTSSYMSAHFEAQSEGRPWSTRRDELDFELELLIDEYVGLMQGPHTAVGPARSRALRRYAEAQAFDPALS
ncbi:helix-turn-helix domain-containing protein [Bradyrhizobium sp. LHD-71]|uniref:TetR/AcrR family transcriptional regulator n=1 Tax=Bradyrhizobium sp. LHD-71 TaxID=3072141 RepID=UPI00280E67B3|nr:helix-turn-helix domain-containing protein [Bradyrhizobium sp. LHD-71]MDQ8730459.1 helix-turn-helix domain-containing protein [Bradyrhizobium sp. LHD-71]